MTTRYGHTRERVNMKQQTCGHTFALRDSRDSSMWSSSELSISSSIPVIFPAMSGYMLWISGNRRSPSICFCSCGGASANMLAVSGSWPCMCRAVGGAIYNTAHQVLTINTCVSRRAYNSNFEGYNLPFSHSKSIYLLLMQPDGPRKHYNICNVKYHIISYRRP